MKPFFIAEVSSNHNACLSRASDLITMCAELGFDAVKFQLFNIDKLFSKEILLQSKAHRDDNQRNECLVCSLNRNDFEKAGIRFEAHVSEDHSVTSYAFFILCA